MTYYAKVYTGRPDIGFLTPGEILTEEQTGKLGAEKIKELCERGVLEALAEAGASSIPTETQSEPERADEPTIEAGDDEELPEIGDAEDLISDEPEQKPAKKTTKSGGRRSKS